MGLGQGERVMDAEKLRKCLEPWVRVDTWNTFHPFDEARFHRCLKSAFAEIGPSISKRDFEDAILALAQSCHGTVLPQEREEVANYWASRAEHIASYVRDVNAR